MLKAVVFDLGKVLVDFDYSIAVRKITARGTKDLAEITQFLMRSPMLIEYEIGLLTNHQFYEAICAATGFRGDFEEFANSFGDIFAPIEPMIQLQAALRARGVPTYIFSNTNDLAVSHIRRNFPFFNHFDGYILSYEKRAMKPEPKIYEALEHESGRRGSELLYLDDRPENVEAGAARGWNVILHESPEKSTAAVHAFGLLDHLA
jgi:HAD superfamily hydrolase (TIGR01509 family)